ncbi:hypothetical protein CDAR_614141 [Caerostris darwini]|uniref:Uncharacterized protein n=1 Tax=Caerostris darwini TaxID=1538125 RepID=A0AAV4WCK0_9ARAC|nr:hypothetical protein CDAR_614141 [Caerostris darwini]
MKTNYKTSSTTALRTTSTTSNPDARQHEDGIHNGRYIPFAKVKFDIGLRRPMCMNKSKTPLWKPPSVRNRLRKGRGWATPLRPPPSPSLSLRNKIEMAIIGKRKKHFFPGCEDQHNRSLTRCLFS